jgi:2-polyprenyl-3-methyl-5-hydroxy-6-metoxy-1,4-benzoquinol methylase
VIATQLGLHTVGVDISATALDASTTYKRETGVKNVEFKVEDFFTMDGSFDLVYDYTYNRFRCSSNSPD